MCPSVAIVTGASRGVGRSFAIGLARDGFRVVAMARNIGKLKSIAAEAGVDESHVLPIQIDFSNLDSISGAIASIPKKFGTLKLVINNAAEGAVGTLDIPMHKFHSLINVNLGGPFRLLQEVVPLLQQAGEGMIINVASRAGKIGFPGWGAYGATKFGLVGLSESLYHELVPEGIKVTTLCPSWINTDMAQECGATLEADQMIDPEDLMKTLRWLLSLSPAACVREVMIECCSDI